MTEPKGQVSTPPTNRILAFIDILGFRAEVIQTGRYSKRVQEILKILQSIQTHGQQMNESTPECEVTVFSDSIVISEPENDDAYFRVVQRTSHLVTELLFLGIACRGGIVKGWLHHSDSIVFGEALVKAYELESKMAVYPRILLEFPVAQQLIPFSTEIPWIRQDIDGMWYVNVFNNLAKHAGGSSKPIEESFMKMNRVFTISQNKTKHETKPGRNWHWLRIKFDESVEYYGSQVFRNMEREFESNQSWRRQS